jgi:hypothetical protein
MIDASDLRALARSIALGVYNNAEDDAFKRLNHVFDMGRMEGKQEAYKAERRAKEARRQSGGQPHG